MLLKEYELLRRDPNWNSIPMLQQIARVFDQDPADCVVEQLPPKGPEPAKIAFTMKLEDLDQGNANFPLYIAILRQSGYQIPDDMLMQMAAHKQQQSAIMTQMSAMGIGGDGAQAAMSGLLPAGNAGGTIPGTISPTPQHGGMAPKAERLNKHQEKQTGQPKGAKPLNQRPNNGIQ